MRKLLTMIALAITLTASVGAADAATFIVPVSYSEWKQAGNTFAAGFEGFASYYSWLTPENRAKYILQGEFDRFGSAGIDQSPSDWQKAFKNVWSNGGGYNYGIEK